MLKCADLMLESMWRGRRRPGDGTRSCIARRRSRPRARSSHQAVGPVEACPSAQGSQPVDLPAEALKTLHKVLHALAPDSDPMLTTAEQRAWGGHAPMRPGRRRPASCRTASGTTAA